MIRPMTHSHPDPVPEQDPPSAPAGGERVPAVAAAVGGLIGGLTVDPDDTPKLRKLGCRIHLGLSALDAEMVNKVMEEFVVYRRSH